MTLDLPFIPGILILLFVYIILTRFWMKIANSIGETVRMFFKNLSGIIKRWVWHNANWVKLIIKVSWQVNYTIGQ